MTYHANESDPLWYHVSNRGSRQLPTFGDPDDCRSFLGLLHEGVDRTASEIHAFALMPNHFHLLFRSTPRELAATMKHIGSVYTRRFNHKYGYDGPLQKGRYWRDPIDSDRRLLATLAYVHNNPIAAKGEHWMLDGYRWTSHPLYTGQRPRPSWLSTGPLLELAGGRRAYAALVASTTALEMDACQPKHTRVRVSSFRAIEEATGIESDTERAAVRAGGRGIRGKLRMIAIILASDHSSESPERIASRYGYSSTGSLRSAVCRGRKVAGHDAAFRELLAKAERRLLR
jgi:REP element-mobilizing transposase RayT